jgi:hypothetical protein
MIATTIMISTSVKPALREVWIFILTVFTFRFGGVNTVTSGFYITACSFTILPVTNRAWLLAIPMPHCQPFIITFKHLITREVAVILLKNRAVVGQSLTFRDTAVSFLAVKWGATAHRFAADRCYFPM